MKRPLARAVSTSWDGPHVTSLVWTNAPLARVKERLGKLGLLPLVEQFAEVRTRPRKRDEPDVELTWLPGTTWEQLYPLKHL